MRRRVNASATRPAFDAGRVVAMLLASVLVLDAATAKADWWRPRGGSGSSSSSGNGSGGYSGSGSGSTSGGRYSGGSSSSGTSGSSRPTTPPRGSYSPGSCSWVTISRQPQYVDPSGRTVYEITQKNTCSGEVRTLFGY